MIEVYDLTKTYGKQLLFEKASFNILQGERIGLVGRNGHGKSTLLRIIIGEEASDEGSKNIPSNYKIGYLRQSIEFTEETVLAEACKGLSSEDAEEIWKVEKILMGLGFTEEDFNKSPGILSGGYQMRINLAKVLVSEPDLLLLDEPTNFLDIVSIRWLESFLKTWKSEFIIVSHDRNFMDSVVTHIVGINRGKIRKIKGNTGKYYSSIVKDEEIHEKRRINEDKKRKQIEEYINTFRAKARRAKSVQSSVKRLNKMGKIDKLENIQTLSFSFNSVPFRAPSLMEAKKISFSYDREEPYLIKGFSLLVERGDKICIAGANGKGKTTLAKMLAGVMNSVKGEIRVNPQVMVSYYEQGNTAKLNDGMTIEEEILLSHPGKHKTEVRNICGAMMFSGDDALKKISVLSGGERSRVLLAKTLLKPSNLLVLDEPTHHLDMESCSALFDAVERYEGASIIVTHDEYFLHKVATKLIIFLDNRIIVFPGNYSEFLEQIGWDTGDVLDVAKKAAQGVKPAASGNKKEERRQRAQELALRREKLGPLEKRIDTLEADIVSGEKEEKVLTGELVKSSEKQDVQAITRFSKELNEVKVKIDSLYDELDNVMSEYEKVKEELE